MDGFFFFFFYKYNRTAFLLSEISIFYNFFFNMRSWLFTSEVEMGID